MRTGSIRFPISGIPFKYLGRCGCTICMGFLRSKLGVGKPAMGYGLGVFHLFLSVSFFRGGGGNVLELGTGVLLILVGLGMVLWGFYHHHQFVRTPV